MWWRLNNDVALKKKHLQSKYSLKKAALVLSTNLRLCKALWLGGIKANRDCL